MTDRASIIEWIRGELVGPERCSSRPEIATFSGDVFHDPLPDRRGPLAWYPESNGDAQEVLYFKETPKRKYGAGLLYPEGSSRDQPASYESPHQSALQAADTKGVDIAEDESKIVEEDDAETGDGEGGSIDDFEVTSPDIRRPSTIGLSTCAKLSADASLTIGLPRRRNFFWQKVDSDPIPLNGRYERRKRTWTDKNHKSQQSDLWCRRPAVSPDCRVEVRRDELRSGTPIRKDVRTGDNEPIELRLELFPRLVEASEDKWLITVVLRNVTRLRLSESEAQAIMYQSFFDFSVSGGRLLPYPESPHYLENLDTDEESLALLYRDSATWAIGHGCAAGWEGEPGDQPSSVFIDVLPAVELPSMTPDIKDRNGEPIQLKMRELANLPDHGRGTVWASLDQLGDEYEAWIRQAKNRADTSLESRYRPAAERHLQACEETLDRIRSGIQLLRSNREVREAFRLANLAMILQQIASKSVAKRFLQVDGKEGRVFPEGDCSTAWDIYAEDREDDSRIGNWRAFQVAFILMSLEGIDAPDSKDREIVDLIWFPTGGGKTEAYLGTAAFYMFYERLLMANGQAGLSRDGTNVLMRYTLRMLTTQQFQRAASLIVAMEFLRRKPEKHRIVKEIPGRRFALGLWVGADGSPNTKKDAEKRIRAYEKEQIEGNPLVLTNCPWCGAEVGRKEKPKARKNDKRVNQAYGIHRGSDEGPLLHCPDPRCDFGTQKKTSWLPIEVIDERIYATTPSLIIGTADKFAISAYRPQARSLFGKREHNGEVQQVTFPPGMIIQDELHLISGPLGTIYGLYEGVFERLCSVHVDGKLRKPKIISSTATIRGASEQVRSLYARDRIMLFPPPGLEMGDSFFGAYARSQNGRLRSGRLYLGIHGENYGSVLTTQVRAFSSALFAPWDFDTNRRDPWWTLLAFYNSLRELGGAKTLFDSDIRSRLKFLFNRAGQPQEDRRNLQEIKELTSRLSQAEIVSIMERLSIPYEKSDSAIDACLASSIIEVGVDIERLSLMAVVGQPKTTATYIQVTGRIGRRWWDRPGLVLTIYNPAKSRDRSHFEKFHSYHRRMYEEVEPTSTTPFSLSAIQRALPGALLAWARLRRCDGIDAVDVYAEEIEQIKDLLAERCKNVLDDEQYQRSIRELERISKLLIKRWKNYHPLEWESYPQSPDGEYLMLWPGQYATRSQKHRGFEVPSSMRQVDSSGRLQIHQGYVND